MSEPKSIGSRYLGEAIRQFRSYKGLAERAMAQVTDDDLHNRPDPESNSIAIQITHMAGNMRSRWRDFLTTDGEKLDRERDREFEDESLSREQLMAIWEEGWQHVFAAVEPLAEADVQRTITIRDEPHTVLQAISRPTSHYAYHVGQIVSAARHLAAVAPEGDTWVSLSVPKGRSDEFNARIRRHGDAK